MNKFTGMEFSFKDNQRLYKRYKLLNPLQKSFLRDINVDALFSKLMTRRLKLFTRAAKWTRKVYPLQYKYSNHIANAGWTYIVDENFYYVRKVLKNRLKLNKSQLDELFSYKLCENSNALLNKNLDDLANNLDNGHKKQVKIIKILINKDKHNCIICFDTLFSILEYLFYINGISSGKCTFSEKVAAKKRKEAKTFSNRYKVFTTLFEWTDYIVVDKLYSQGNYQQINYNKVPYSRNTVIHGKFNPDNFKFVDFLKLILVCRNISYDVKDSKNIEETYLATRIKKD